MPITLPCPHCRGALTAADGSEGSALICPHCAQPVTVPANEFALPDDAPFATGAPPRYRRRKTTKGNIKPLLIGAGAVAVVAAVLVWFFTRTDPEVARVEAEYSELCDKIDYHAKELEKPNKDKRVQALDPDLMYAVAELRPLLDRRESLVNQFYKKYGRNPCYLKPGSRDYRGTPIK